ncbi:MAG: FMN-binding protein [Acidobacteria bacterium]|nr:FMN-binding protein [Acidobacteriota bacterium]MBI3658791.1 FMN-binding protein [Acidobacteriota bacterium]
MITRQFALAASALVWLQACGNVYAGDKDFTPRIYIEINEAPRAVFPGATRFERKDVVVTKEMSQNIRARVGQAKPTIWETSYITFIAKKDTAVIGYAIICEEIGKHYPMTFIVGVTPAGQIEDVAILAYREPYGGEVRYKGFLRQFQKKSLKNPIMPYKDIVNVTGATLSVRALTRGVRKALAAVQTIYLDETAKAGGK